MPKAAPRSPSEPPRPRAGMVIEAVTTYEELPIVTEAARAELLASLASSRQDVEAGRAARMSVAEFQSELRSDFEAITGYKAR